MKFACERDALAEAFSVVGRAVSSRGSSLPVLSGIRIELTGDRLQLTGSDLDLTISRALSVNGSTAGTAVIPAKLVTEIVRVLEPGRVQVEVADEEARIKAGRSEFSLRVLPAAEYPRVTELDGEGVELEAAGFAEALRQVTVAASTDEARPVLTGVLLAPEDGGLRLVATDSYRLAVRDLPGTSFLAEGQSVLVPSAALKELNRLLGATDSVTVRLGDRDASFTLGDATVVTRLIEGEFPNYRNLIPSSQPNRLTVGRDALLDAVRRVRVVASEPATPVRLDMTEDGLQLSANADVGTASEQVDAKYEGSDLLVAFNPQYLLEGVEAATGDEVTLETLDASKPAVLRATDSEDFLYLLMPVRVGT